MEVDDESVATMVRLLLATAVESGTPRQRWKVDSRPSSTRVWKDGWEWSSGGGELTSLSSNDEVGVVQLSDHLVDACASCDVVG